MLLKLKQGAYDNIWVFVKHLTYITIPWDNFNGSCLILTPPAHIYIHVSASYKKTNMVVRLRLCTPIYIPFQFIYIYNESCELINIGVTCIY